MKISEIKIGDIKTYLVLDPGDEEFQDDRLLEICLSGAKKVVSNYCGITIEDLDKHEDLTFVVLIISGNMYENRNLMEKDKDLNKLVEIVLGASSFNLLG